MDHPQEFVYLGERLKMNDSIKNWIIEWFKENTELKDEEIKIHDNYFEKGWIDSFQFISFVSDLEKKYDIHFSNDEFQDRSFSTIGGVVEIIGRRINEKG